MGKIKRFLRLRSANSTTICRVSDLLNKGFSKEEIADEIIRINEEVWGGITKSQYIWTREMMVSQFEICPELLWCAFENGKMVANATGFYTNNEDLKIYKSWLEKTANGFYTNHRPEGEIAFGADLSVTRGASKKASSRIMLTLLLISIIGAGRKSMCLGSRIPSYHKHKDMKVEDYVFGKRPNGKPLDPELYFYMKDGFEIVEIIPEYMEDPDSLNYGVLIKWNNPLYKVTKALPFLKPVIRWIGKKLFLRLP